MSRQRLSGTTAPNQRLVSIGLALGNAQHALGTEGLTNAVKHGHATRLLLAARGRLVVSVVDDGIGGAATHNGSGLTGLSDRVLTFPQILREL